MSLYVAGLSHLRLLLCRIVRDERGQGMVEYGLIIALIAVAMIVFLGPMRDALGDIFEDVTGALQNPGTAGGAGT